MNHGALYGKSMIPNEIMNVLNENACLHRNNLSLVYCQSFIRSFN
jgi:hypothetical protein